MKGQLTRAKNAGYRIIYIDETMFTRKTLPASEWTQKKENMRVNIDKIDEPTMALLCGISKENGLEQYMVFKRSVNIDKFKEFLDGLKQANGEAKICLFMDNLKVHKSEMATTEMKRLGFRCIYNLKYSPE